MPSATQEKKRKSPRELAMAIFGALPVQDLKSKTQIAREIGSKPDTVEEYLQLIMWVQTQPRVTETKVGLRRYAYRRDRAKKERGF